MHSREGTDKPKDTENAGHRECPSQWHRPLVALCLGLGRRLEFRASLVRLKNKQKILRLLDPSVGKSCPGLWASSRGGVCKRVPGSKWPKGQQTVKRTLNFWELGSIPEGKLEMKGCHSLLAAGGGRRLCSKKFSSCLLLFTEKSASEAQSRRSPADLGCGGGLAGTDDWLVQDQCF